MPTEPGGHIEEWKTIGLSEGDVHRLLAAERRRLALDILEGGGPTELEDLAEAVVRLEGHGEVTGRAVERAAVDLNHCHLPLMADLGVVEFDRRSGGVEARRRGGGSVDRTADRPQIGRGTRWKLGGRSREPPSTTVSSP